MKVKTPSMSCLLKFVKPGDDVRLSGEDSSPSSQQDISMLAPNTRDLHSTLHQLKSGNMSSLHSISINQCQENTSGSFQETENSMTITLSRNKGEVDNDSHLSKVLTLLSPKSNHISLKDIEFHSVEWTQSEFKHLRSLLDDNIIVQQLVFKQNTFDVKCLFDLSEMLGRNRGLQVLIFFNCQIGSFGTKLISSALTINMTLVELQIWEDSIGPEAAEELSRMIEINTNLRLLIILDNYFTAAMAVISAVIARNRNVEVHVWEKSSSDGRSKVVEFIPQDGILRIYKADISSAKRIAQSLAWNMTVRTLDLTGVQLNSKWAKEFRRILEHNRSIKHVNLSRTCLRDKAVVYIAAGLFKNKSLESLQLDGNLYSGIGVEHLLCPLTRFSPVIEQANTSLKVISFGGVKTKLSQVGVSAILQMLKTNETIVNLGIHDDTSLKMNDVIRIFQSLEKNTTIKHLSLRRCKGVAGELVLQAIMDVLQVNPWVEEIDLSGTPLENAGMTKAIHQKLGRNGIFKPEKDIICSLPMTKPKVCRIFFCGHELSGKTTLCYSLSSNLSPTKFSNWNQIKMLATAVEQVVRIPKIKFKTLQIDEDMEISIWELPDQQDLHILQENMFPRKPSASFFLVICSLLSRTGKVKNNEVIEWEILYWLRFIVSNSKRLQPQLVLPNVTVVFTHFDKVSWQSDFQMVTDLIGRLREMFHGFADIYPTIFTVDARSTTSVSKLAHHIRKTGKTILERTPPVYKLANDLVKILQKWRSENNNKPVIKWNEFCELCQLKVPSLRIRGRHGDMGQESRRKVVLKSLQCVSEVIYLEDLSLLILDLDWFYNEMLIQLLRLDAYEKNSAETIRFVNKKELEKILQDKLQSRIPGFGSKMPNKLDSKDLIEMMLKLELCYEQEIGNPNSPLLIPAMLVDGRKKEQKWNVNKLACFYVGRHIECDDSSRMFLPTGFFPRLQVHLHNKILRKNYQYSAKYSLEKYLITLIINGINVRVELGGKPAYHIDIMACSEKNSTEILRFLQQLIIPSIHSLCNGVNLMESIIRPDCVRNLIPPRYRKNQHVPLGQLKQALLFVPAEYFYEYQHTWNSVSDGTRKILQPGSNYARDLLSDEEFREILQQRYYDLHLLATELTVKIDNAENKNQEDETEQHYDIEPSLSGIAKGVEEVLKRLRIIENEIKDIKQEIQSLRYYEQRLLSQLHQKVNYMVNYNIHLEERKIPCLFYFVQTENYTKRLVTSIFSGMAALQLHMLCEFRGEIHAVDDQIGCELMQLDNQALKALLPYLRGFMKLLTMSLKIGAHLVAGLGEMIPDLSREVAHLVSSHSVYGTAATVAAAGAGIIGAAAISYGGRNSKARGSSGALGGGGARNFGQDIIIARQWLVDFFKERRILTGKDIAERFSLWRVRYRNNGQIAWICSRHIETRANEVIQVPI